MLFRSSSQNGNKIKIIDFGLATIVTPEIPEKTVCGSPGYLAPELYAINGYDTKVGLFSFGVLLYVM